MSLYGDDNRNRTIFRSVSAPKGWSFESGDPDTHYILTNKAFQSGIEHHLEQILEGAYRLVRKQNDL